MAGADAAAHLKEQRQDAQIPENAENRNAFERRRRQELADEARITPIGRFIRKSCLPQRLIWEATFTSLESARAHAPVLFL